MNLDAFRHFYNYHFAENRKIWNYFVTQLSQEQFTQAIDYSQGSVRNQFVHLMNVDRAWFSHLSGREISEELNPPDSDDRAIIRETWDKVEQGMREYLATLSDAMLFEKPLEGEDENLIVWQVLLHVVNHGTDHRAQILRALKDLGLETPPQDYIFYVYDNP
jgi:uncharacterized damage-inducible protein DinB